MSEPILKAEHLGITFGGLKAVSDFNMTINSGELVGLIGPNGAGKTTVFNLLTGVYQPTEGEFFLDGERMNGKKTYQVVRAGIARTFQNIRLFGQMTVEENVLVAFNESFSYHMGGAIFRTPKFWKQEREMHAKAIDLLKIFGLEGLAETEAANLPYGAQRKLEIARALATGMKLLLLDEPAAGMNPTETEDLLNCINTIRDRFGIAILLIEHDMSLVMNVCQRIQVLDYGRTIAARAGRDRQQPAGHLRIPGFRRRYRQRRCQARKRGSLMLEVKNLSVSYGAIEAVKDISFTVNDGEIVSLIGANGAGKTTTLHTITGLVPAKSGSMMYNGVDLLKTHNNKIVTLGMAHIPEGRHVFTRMSVEENLEMGAFSLKDQSDLKKDLDMVYGLFPRLKERRNQKAGTLSGGEQQMLAMGRALMSHPKTILMDEPSMGLSPKLVKEIFSIIRKLHEQGITILLVEQNAKMALSIADRAYVLETGRITMEGDAKELLNNEQVRKAYLGA